MVVLEFSGGAAFIPEPYDYDYLIILFPLKVPSDADHSNKSYDHMLHQSLEKIFRERCLSSSEQFKEFIRGPQHNSDCNSIIKPILEQEPCLSRTFSKEGMGKFSVLWITVLGFYEKSAELLVRSGADVNELLGCHDPQIIDEKWTILHALLLMASSPEKERLIRLVIDHGADLQARDCQGRTVLHIAVMRKRVEITEVLLEKGAVVSAVDNDGMTPLLVAAKFNNSVLVTLLLKHGADVFAKSGSGMNALHLIMHSVELARFFIEKGVSVDDTIHGSHDQPIHWAAGNGNTELVELYLDHGANVNALLKTGESPLFFAAETGRVAAVETLIKRGANVNLRNIKNRTALHVACEYAMLFVNADNNWKNIIRLLVSAGADVLAENSEGLTPFAFILPDVSDGERLGQRKFLPLIDALVLKKALQPSIELKDEKIIQRYPKLWDYYRKCTDEMDRMKCRRFIETSTLFELLSKSPCQIATLMQNPEFETKFKLYDLNDGLSIYTEHVVRAFERAQDHYRSLLEQADVIDVAVYNILPYLVVKKVVHYIFNCCDNVK